MRVDKAGVVLWIERILGVILGVERWSVMIGEGVGGVGSVLVV